jgi:hypothetical protein
MNASLRELAHREQDGLQVTLFWNSHSNKVSIEVLDECDESSFLIPVASHSALDAFHHPYAYASANDVALHIGSAESAKVTS